ncbi:MAG: TRAP transporter substrate-binding protein [Clostridia bacterium]|nr:TRAP transporter substrate-binding protein [Clostridia bacterium]
MKKILALALVLLMVMSASAFAAEYQLRFATSSTQTGIKYEAIDLMLNYIEEKSDGRIEVTRYIDGDLYQNAEDMLAGLSTGVIDACFEGDMSLSWVAPEWISYTSIPFAFDNMDHMLAFFNSDVAKGMNDELISDYGYRFLDAVWARGGRMLTANEPITNPSQMEGLKFRVPNVIGTVTSWEAMGATVIGVPWSELFTSLQNGLVDAQENPYAEIESGGFYQVQKYIMETAHQYGPQLIFVSEAWYQSLPDDLKQVMQDANTTASEFFNAGVQADEDRIREVVKAAGTTIIPKEEIDIDAFRAVIEEKVIPQFENNPEAFAEGGWEYIRNLEY